MLPHPVSPSHSLQIISARARSVVHNANPRVCLAFFIFGLLNNLPYVLLLSSALDLLGPTYPKSLLLLFDVLPGFAAKLTFPYFIHYVPYSVRMILLSLIASAGMLLVSLSPGSDADIETGEGGSVGWKLTGVAMASLASGAGELTFMGLTHFYGSWGLAAWGSGTGAAGLVGAGAYALLTTGMGWTGRGVIGGAAVLSMGLAGTYFGILPAMGERGGRFDSTRNADADEDEERDEEEDGLLGGRQRSKNIVHVHNPSNNWRNGLRKRFSRSRSLFFPYMLPLFLVYVAEYLINQGVTPTLLFPLPTTPFTTYRSFYPTYALLYQTGVFISRSSSPFLRLHNLYPPSLLQLLNLLLLILQSLFFSSFLPSVWLVFALVFWEGLLGGAVYVNTFAEISEGVEEAEREFSLGAVTVSDSAGICVAGFLGIPLEVGLCSWQVGRGRDWCRRV